MEANENELINQEGEAFWDLGRAKDIEPRVSQICAAVRGTQPAFFMTEKANELRLMGCDDETILLDAVHAGYVKLCKARTVQYIEDIHPSVAVEHLRGLPVLEDGGLVPYLDLIKTIEASYRSIVQTAFTESGSGPLYVYEDQSPMARMGQNPGLPVLVLNKVNESKYVSEFVFKDKWAEKPAKLVLNIHWRADSLGYEVEVQLQMDGYLFNDDYLEEDDDWEEGVEAQFATINTTDPTHLLVHDDQFHEGLVRRLGIMRQLLEGEHEWLRKAGQE